MTNAIDTAFAKAVSTLQKLSIWSAQYPALKPPQADRVELYGLYKQATEGDISDQNVPFPTGDSQESDVARWKWRSWKGKEGMSSEEAKQHYTQYLLDIMKIYASGYDDTEILESELEVALQNAKESTLESRKPARSEYTNFDTSAGHQGVRRAESPAVSLYRVASSGFNSKIARPPSRSYSTTNTNQNIKSDNIGFGVITGESEVAGNFDLKDDETNEFVNPSRIDFIRWQNQVNYALTKITQKLDRMNNDQPTTSSLNLSQKNPGILAKGNNTNTDKLNTNHEKRFLKLLYELRKITTDTMLKIYNYSKSCFSSARSRTVIIVLIYLIIQLRKSLRFHSFYQKLASTMIRLFSRLQTYFDRGHSRSLKTNNASHVIVGNLC